MQVVRIRSRDIIVIDFLSQRCHYYTHMTANWYNFEFFSEMSIIIYSLEHKISTKTFN